ncbi:unnamed protein product [Paramecium primaurelia]|uniref:Cilia-and flagella-associated protein 96 n=1 Tax=Paramecium primaurelia TaxID=5886 RepID=A0A8S1QGA6_PARPR|nr:unnamed protein product [Paramecium primaurelia]
MSNSQEREQELKQIRKEMLKDAEMNAQKQRFGLFSSPVPLGLGDDSMEMRKKPQRGENGKPITEPSNIKVSATRTGRIRSSYFGPLSFTTVGDPYIDPEKVLVHYEKEQKKLINKEAPFKPPSGYKELIGSAYQHMKDYDYKKVESRKQSDGRVYSAPRNVTTNPRCKVMDKSIPYMTDEYNRYSDFERKARMQSKSKEKEQPFRSTVHGGPTFEKDKNLYGETKMPSTSQRKSPDLKQAKHESAFRPVNGLKKGLDGLFGHFEYKPDPMREIKRQFSSKKERESFKPADLGNKTRPNPTISCFKMNIRREMAGHY